VTVQKRSVRLSSRAYHKSIGIGATSQCRTEAKDRQWERLSEIRQIQIEMMLEQAKSPRRIVKVREVIKRKARKAPKPAVSEEAVADIAGA